MDAVRCLAPSLRIPQGGSSAYGRNLRTAVETKNLEKNFPLFSRLQRSLILLVARPNSAVTAATTGIDYLASQWKRKILIVGES